MVTQATYDFCRYFSGFKMELLDIYKSHHGHLNWRKIPSNNTSLAVSWSLPLNRKLIHWTKKEVL